MYIKTIIKRENEHHFIESVKIEITSNKKDIDLDFRAYANGEEALKAVLSIEEALRMAFDVGRTTKETILKSVVCEE